MTRTRPRAQRDTMARRLVAALGIGRRGWPIVTSIVFAVTALNSAAQLVYPPVFHALNRNPEALAAGQYWRVVTWMVVQDGWLAGTIANLVALAIVGWAFERTFGSARWLLLYAVVGPIAQIPGFFWNPYGAGNSVPVAVLFGALVALLLAAPRWLGVTVPVPLRMWGVIIPVLAVVDTAFHDNHGVAVLLGTLSGLVIVWPRRCRRTPMDCEPS